MLNIKYDIIITLFMILFMGNCIATNQITKNDSKEVEFLKAADTGDINFVKKYIDDGGSMDVRSSNGSNALFIASAKCNEKVVRLLLEKGAKLDQVQNRSELDIALAYAGYTLALADQTEYGLCINLATYLIDNGAQTDIKDSRGNTLLINAVSASAPKVVKKLLLKKIDVNSSNLKGVTALMEAASPMHPPAELENIKIINLLINAGAEKKLKNKKGETAYDIHKARETPNEIILKLLKPV